MELNTSTCIIQCAVQTELCFRSVGLVVLLGSPNLNAKVDQKNDYKIYTYTPRAFVEWRTHYAVRTTETTNGRNPGVSASQCSDVPQNWQKRKSACAYMTHTRLIKVLLAQIMCSFVCVIVFALQQLARNSQFHPAALEPSSHVKSGHVDFGARFGHLWIFKNKISVPQASAPCHRSFDRNVLGIFPAWRMRRTHNW